MTNNIEQRVSKADSTLIQNLVERFPMGCVCFEPVFNERHAIENFVIIHINEGFEEIIGLNRNVMIGKVVSEVFGAMNKKILGDLVRLINEAYLSKTQTCEVKARVFDHVYKVSFIFLSDDRLLVIFEDIHSKYFRKHYHRSIPREVMQTSFIKAQHFVPQNEMGLDQQTVKPEAGEETLFVENFKPVEILCENADTVEPYDAVFRDSLTGLYNRVFAMEALNLYVDSEVLPLSVVMGDVNGLKAINESLGFQAGDEILVKIAQVLQDNCREDDLVTRWHDGQFMLLLPHAVQTEAQYVIKRLQAKLNAIFDDKYNIVTFGYATSETEHRTPEDLIREAEKWIHQKKLLINQSHRSSIIRLLVSMLHEKSADTEKHSDRMAAHCRWIAKKLHLSDEMIDDLVLLSMLHDIGKIGIPDNILNKPAALTAAERMMINQHPEIGYRIAQTIPELKQVADYILTHHERWDGTGYPKGLRGEEIPIASRIIAMVDAFDVMVTGRSYQAAKSKSEALAELKRCAGTQFDPGLVSTYAELLSKEG